MSEDPICRIVILGGGLTGWMAAAALARTLPPGRCTIHLVETSGSDPDSIGGVESTLPAGRAFFEALGIDEDRLLCGGHGAFALGTAWSNWASAGLTYFAGFGDVGASLDGVGFHHLARRLRESGQAIRLANYSLATIAAQLGRFARPSGDPRSILSTFAYGFHLPLADHKALWRRLALEAGVVAAERPFASAIREEDGDLAAIVLGDGSRLDGDLFLDCSGARALLIDGALDTGFESWRAWLPCDGAASVASHSAVPPAPYSHVEGLDWGWRCEIPAQGLTGQMIVFASDQVEPELAAAQLRERLAEPAIGDIQMVRFEAGRRSLAWNRNCVALGDAAAMLEPFPSVRLHLAQRAVLRLLRLFPQARSSPAEAAEYNRQTIEESERLRDYLILRYKYNGRTGAPLWDRCRAMTVPEPLAHKIAIWSSRGRVPLYDEETFEEPDWALLFDVHGVRPRRHDPLADAIPDDRLARHMDRLRELVLSNASALPVHADYLRDLCHGGPAR